MGSDKMRGTTLMHCHNCFVIYSVHVSQWISVLFNQTFSQGVLMTFVDYRTGYILPFSTQPLKIGVQIYLHHLLWKCGTFLKSRDGEMAPKIRPWIGAGSRNHRPDGAPCHWFGDLSCLLLSTTKFSMASFSGFWWFETDGCFGGSLMFPRLLFCLLPCSFRLSSGTGSLLRHWTLPIVNSIKVVLPPVFVQCWLCLPFYALVKWVFSLLCFSNNLSLNGNSLIKLSSADFCITMWSLSCVPVMCSCILMVSSVQRRLCLFFSALVKWLLDLLCFSNNSSLNVNFLIKLSSADFCTTMWSSSCGPVMSSCILMVSSVQRWLCLLFSALVKWLLDFCCFSSRSSLTVNSLYKPSSVDSFSTF